MNDFEKELNFDSDTFCDMKKDMNYILQRLLGNMIEKSSKEGSLTVKIDVILGKEQIPDYGLDTDGKYREISKPLFKHTIQSTVKINDKVNGILNPGMELVMDAAMYYSRSPTPHREPCLILTLWKTRIRPMKARIRSLKVLTSRQTKDLLYLVRPRQKNQQRKKIWKISRMISWVMKKMDITMKIRRSK